MTLRPGCGRKRARRFHPPQRLRSGARGEEPSRQLCRFRHTFRPWGVSRRRENEKTFVEPSSRILVSQKLPNYLKTYRKRAGLSQADLAYLLGVRSGTKVSRYERFSRVPNLETALAFEALYHLPVADLFAGVADDRARDVLRRARLVPDRPR